MAKICWLWGYSEHNMICDELLNTIIDRLPSHTPMTLLYQPAGHINDLF